MDTIKTVSGEIEAQSLNAIVAGFSFAAAISWMDVTRWVIPQIVSIQKNGGAYYLLTALFTTLLSVIIFMVMSRLSSRVVKPNAPIYAIGR